VIAVVFGLLSVTVALLVFPVPSRLEVKDARTAEAKGFTPAFWFYVAAAACFGAGLMSFEFVSYHLSSRGTVTEHWIPLFLAMATAMGVVASLVLGRLYDHFGLPVVLGAVFIAALFSPFVFLG